MSFSGKLIGSLGWRFKRGLKGTEVRTGEEELKRGGSERVECRALILRRALLLLVMMRLRLGYEVSGDGGQGQWRKVFSE